ncbi:hypothetical protein HI914_05551 [Erysiphe necator]|uniref:Putative small secreted protein n=1 Tax=Uncinula necator TaxID=52586 RepID=A0A0B1NZW4_UNCNE|nr:hypothetical protein HI914_05526 [Erysiphe necator]KAI6246314.1 hypothetical protein HI914_05551 [Erysiphe necator]KHJ30580.1 putative small secreted protein [Erysiphe necator]
MRFSIALLSFILIAIVVSTPIPDSKDSKDSASDKSEKSSSKSSSKSSDKDSSATKATASQGGASILSSQPYSDLQISDGEAGQAEQEAAARFQGIDKGDLASVSDADVKLIKGIHDIAEKAEVEAFNPAIEAATGDEAKALQNGKIKNKVLKTSATVLALEIQAAKGENVDADKLTKEKAKKAKNIALDVAAKGQASKSVTISGSS